MNKDESVLKRIRAAEERLGKQAFVVVDHWDADPNAIGFARTDDVRYLVYVSTGDKYFVELEAPPTDEELPYSVAGSFNEVDFEQLTVLLRSHLLGA